MTGNLVARVIKYLGAIRAANRDNWKGACITRLAYLYDAYPKTRQMTRKKLQRLAIRRAYKQDQGIAGEEVKKHLMLGVEYAYLARTEGDIAEFGTESGRTAHIIATALTTLPWQSMVTPRESRATPKKLYLFDSFEGLPIAEATVDKEHPYVISGAWMQGQCKGLNQDELIAVVCKTGLPRDRIVVHAGWFRDTLPRLPDDTKFAMLHIDCDLYQSTMDVLDVCFSRGFIAAGAIIFFDDWNMNKASPEFGERKAWSEIVGKYSVKYSDEGGYAWNGHKFIVHSYKRK